MDRVIAPAFGVAIAFRTLQIAPALAIPAARGAGTAGEGTIMFRYRNVTPTSKNDGVSVRLFGDSLKRMVPESD